MLLPSDAVPTKLGLIGTRVVICSNFGSYTPTGGRLTQQLAELLKISTRSLVLIHPVCEIAPSEEYSYTAQITIWPQSAEAYQHAKLALAAFERAFPATKAS